LDLCFFIKFNITKGDIYKKEKTKLGYGEKK